jgi:RimJ/RimL family protein N-acetyltransferase
LRPFRRDDAADVQRLANDRDIAAMTLNIPHPYGTDAAVSWISAHPAHFRRGEAATYAITLAASGELMGAIGLHFRDAHERAEMGYWIGKPYWNQGYTTEAAQALLAYGFEQRGLNRIQAAHLANNPASGRVMEKIGMEREGLARQYIKKWGRFYDMVFYAILREAYEAG